MRLGIFGGTFDPPHIGHLILAAEAHQQLELDRVLWVLTFHPPHKLNQSISSLQHRLDMVQAAIDDDWRFKLSRIDIDRPAPHYAVDTVRLLGEKYPDSELVYLMGGDSLENLPSWYQPHEFTAGCRNIGVMRRLGDKIDFSHLEIKIPGITPKIQVVAAPLVEIAASQIRQRIRKKYSFRYFLPAGVYEIIKKRKLYQIQE
jgi:nicotinate-nucleotide adenylyltransferase